MTLVDTSVWIDHLRRGNPRLSGLLTDGDVLTHPFVIGELACGLLNDRERILELLDRMPSAVEAAHAEAMAFAGTERLWGSGIGWVDVHLLASARLSRCVLWTMDRRLARAAEVLGLGD